MERVNAPNEPGTEKNTSQFAKDFATENKLARPGRLCCPLGLSDTVQTRENLGVSCSRFLCLTQVLTQILFFPWRVWFDASFVVPA